MSLHARAVRRTRRLLTVLAVTAITGLGALTPTTASASVRPAAAPAASVAHAPATPAVRVAAPRSRPSVNSLTVTGAATTVVVHRVYRSGQRAWIDHVLDGRLLDVDGCQARRGPSRWRGHVYRATVYSACPGGIAAATAVARRLQADRPWYRVSVSATSLVGFSLVADLPSGNDRALPAALAKLPAGPSVFFEGDDVSLMYAGPGVTQSQLDAAVSAFAAALHVPASRVKVWPLGV